MAEGGGLIDLFGTEGQAALARLARCRTLYAFDFDGTLAPIVERPEDARASDATVRLLSRLATLVPTALLSGRGVEELRRMIAFAPRHVVGNHGAEGLALPAADRDAHAAIVAGWRAQWADLAATLPAGIVLEAKKLSLSIHYRAAHDHDHAVRCVLDTLPRLVPQPRVIGGKSVFNLLPDGAPDKGVALARLVEAEGCEAAFFIGDDLTDEAAFIEAPADWVTVHVGDDETSAARYRIPCQSDIERCVQSLLHHVDPAGH